MLHGSKTKEQHEGPLVIEFVGLPGAGKSTISRLLADRLHTLGFQCRMYGEASGKGDAASQPIAVNEPIPARFTQTLFLLWRRLPLLLHTFWYTLHVKPITAERFRRAVQFLKKYCAVQRVLDSRISRETDMIIFDQSLLQAIWSIAAEGIKPPDHLLTTLLRDCRPCLGHVIVNVIVDSNVASDRIQHRPRRKHRFDLMPHDEAARTLAAQATYFDHLLHSLEALPGVRLLQVANDGCPEETVQRATEFITQNLCP